MSRAPFPQQPTTHTRAGHSRARQIICKNPKEHGPACDCAWVAEQLKYIPSALTKTVTARYSRIENRRERNTFLRKLAHDGFAATMHIKPFAWPIEDLYVDKKGRTRKKYRHEYVDIAGYMQDLCSKDDSEICDLASILTETLLHKWDKVGAAHHPMLERRLRRYLRRAAHQQSEMFAYELGLVKEGRQEVVSDMTAHRRAQQLEDTIEWAGRTTIITEMGKVRLSEVIDTNNRKQITLAPRPICPSSSLGLLSASIHPICRSRFRGLGEILTGL